VIRWSQHPVNDLAVRVRVGGVVQLTNWRTGEVLAELELPDQIQRLVDEMKKLDTHVVGGRRYAFPTCSTCGHRMAMHTTGHWNGNGTGTKVGACTYNEGNSYCACRSYSQ
jgi:hypothetical protein